MNGHRRYGCLLRAGGGVVEDNTFADTTGAGVVLTNEPDWPEGPVPWEITIRRNQFIRGGTCLGYADSPRGAALVVRATRLGHGLAEAEAIRTVIIEHNAFVDRAGAAVFVGGASKVTLRGNRITAEADAELRRRGPAILIERSSGVALTQNAVSDPRPDTTAAIEVGRGVPPGRAGVSISDLKAMLAPGATPVLGIEDAVTSGAAGPAVQPSNLNWVRAGINTNGLRWGIQGRLLWGLPPPSGKAPDGPRGPDFTPHRIFPLERLCRTPEGDVLVAVTTDEADPTAAPAPPQARHWYYGGLPVMQYWRKPTGTWRSDLHVAVNGRYTYWMSRHPIPGGISFENFELREYFHSGQQFNFGITRQSPADLGL